MTNHIHIAESLTDILENRFKFFGVSIGLDPIIGLLFGAGDLFTLLVGLYYIWVAKQYKLPDSAIARMMGNIAIDFFIGLIPFIGDLFDFSFKAHSRNLQILKSYVDSDYSEKTLDSIRTT